MNTLKINFKDLDARTRGFQDDELCACMNCDEENVPYKEFRKGGKHYMHQFFPYDAFQPKKDG